MHQTQPGFWTVFCLCLTFANPLVAQDVDVQETLSQARAKYDVAIEKADDELVEAIKLTIQNAAAEGDLDKVREMMKVEKDFREQKTEPRLKVLEDSSAKYRQLARDAAFSYKEELKNLEVELTRRLRTENAESVRAVIEQFGESKEISGVERDVSSTAAPTFARFAGTWDFKWGTTENSILYSFRIDRTGKIYWQDDRPAQLVIRDNRVLWLSESSHLNLELICRDNELIVLGWTVRKGRHPVGSTKNALARQPDQVGIAYKK